MGFNVKSLPEVSFFCRCYLATILIRMKESEFYFWNSAFGIPVMVHVSLSAPQKSSDERKLSSKYVGPYNKFNSKM